MCEKSSPQPDDGGAAFPDPYTDGMTLRDYFAAQAMLGLLGLLDGDNQHQADTIPGAAYAVADAMLKARNA